ncbi:MAG: F0F1 ATP synthase subunit epsilon [Patescibacteria group bacterium]|jgi:F-type H+-transporting ATPase subunit epsilon
MADAEQILDVLIVDPNKIVYEGKAVKIFAPAKIGETAFLPQHTPLYTELEPGNVVIEEVNGNKVEQKIDGGVARIKNNTLKILIGF